MCWVKKEKKKEETAGWAAGLPHIKNPRRVSMGRKLKVNVVAAAAQRPATFFPDLGQVLVLLNNITSLPLKKPTLHTLSFKLLFLVIELI